jgi:hypothetical protein
LKTELAFVDIEKLPPLAFSNDRFHFLGFDIFVHLPLTDPRAVLPHLGHEAIFPLNGVLDLSQWEPLRDVELDNPSFVRLPSFGFQCWCFPFACAGRWTHSFCGQALIIGREVLEVSMDLEGRKII